jgi:hypothetical protein
MSQYDGDDHRSAFAGDFYFVTVMWILFMTLVLSGVPQRAHSADSDTRGPHQGIVMGDAEDQFEVVVDAQRRSVDVYTLKSTHKAAQSVGIELTPRRRGEGGSLRLRATDPWRGLPHYSGQLANTIQDSQVGIKLELKFGSRQKTFECRAPCS